MTDNKEDNKDSKKDSKQGKESTPSHGQHNPVQEKPAPVQKEKAVNAPATVRSGLPVLVKLAYQLLLIVGIAISGFYVYEQDKAINVLFQQQNDFNSERSRVIENTTLLQESINALQNAMAALEQESAAQAEQQSAEIVRLQNELVSTRLRISSNNPGASKEWLLAEAASLLRLAQQQMIVGRNMRTAQALFIAADDVLEQIDDPAIFAVREVLVGELASIRAGEEVDIRSIYLELGGIAGQLSGLQVSNDLARQVNEGERLVLSDTSDSAEDGIMGTLISRFTQTLDNYLVVRRRDEPLDALMTPGQEAALMQSIRLQLEQGRTALLRQEQEIYTSSLSRARAAIDDYLAGNASLKTRIIDDLDRLSARRIVTEPPPLSRTRTALEQILDVREAGTDTQ